ncbi:TetR family transcriptional regulator [Nocardioides antri]|uniref:TetR family transcriptional regulator n=2 Tax=Nocardioides antri TaxID=2607659 RepID=A0A5B1M1R1_9ACTN|nr:TetR family transcriptional regulator [Nocardioides antri]
MDDLAAAADVSRRTVFNYFDSKADVVLGPEHEIPETTVEVFVAGGPTGRLFDDLVHIAVEALEEKGADLELVHLRRDVMRKDARVLAIAHERFETITDQARDMILEREGEDYDAYRARLLVQLLITIVDSVLDRSDADLARPLPELVDAAVSDARAVLNS